MAHTTNDIRNIALIGHGGSGKTSLTEALLKAGGAIHQAGQVEKGSTVGDHTDEEKEHSRSLYSAVTHCDYQGKRINIIDTPGAADFSGQSIAALPAVETALLVINATAGIEPNARRLFDRARTANLARMIVINKIDSDNLDLSTLVDQLRESFGSECLPINLPTGGGSGVVDVLNKAEGEVDFSSVEDAHTAIVDQVVEIDDALMEKYLEQGEVSPDELQEPFRKAMSQGHLIPICFTSSRNHDDVQASVGVRELLDIIANLLPSPVEGNPRDFSSGEDTITAEADASKPALAHAFKIAIDRFGRMGVLKVHQGTINKDTPLFVGDARKPIKLGHLYALQGKDHVEINSAVAGDICAIMKIEEVHQNSVFRSDDGDLTLNMKFPEPMFGLAIAARKRGEEGKISEALRKIEDEEPLFKVERNQTTHELVIYGMGEQHLRIILEKMLKKYGVDVETHAPKIAYKETIRGKGEGHHRHKKQSGGSGQFGEVYCRVEPSDPGQGLDFVNELVGESIPRQYLPAIRKGVEQAMSEGTLAGCPIQDVRVAVYDGKHHAVDSKEVAFLTAGKKAFLDGFHKAKPVLLEPIVHVEVVVPNSNMGDINGDLSGKRGRIQGTDMLPGDMACITAEVPLSEMMNYQSQLKSVTGGQGTYTMELSHYDAVPGNVQQQIVASYKPKAEED